MPALLQTFALRQHALCVQKCGDIRTLYSACKHQGFVLISYYDGRAGNYAKAALDGMPVNNQPLQIEPSLPGQKVHDKDTQSGGRVSVEQHTVSTAS